MNNIYDIFPKEIWINIILELPCKFIYNLYYVSTEFKQLCHEEDLVKQRKFKGYPRITGHCKSYVIYDCIGQHYNTNGDLVDNKTLKRSILLVRHNPKSFKLMLDNILAKLYDNNTDLVRGDLIDFEIGGALFLFDGENIIDNYYDHNFTLPKDMDIINDNLPLEYWRETGLTGFNKITFNCNISLFKDQLINNISYNDIPFGPVNSTWFLSNDKKYIIGFPKYLSSSEIKEKFINDKILLIYHDIFGRVSFACQ